MDRITTPDDCWPWTGDRDRKGYGRIKVNGRWRQATHIALELSGFIIPAEFLQVRHYVCDNPPCCRPSHLTIGTPQDDRNDQISKGRQARGNRLPQAKLQNGYATADEIRRLYTAGGITQKTLAQQFGIHPATIRRILRGETWNL